jgi:hypothetical protein
MIALLLGRAACLKYEVEVAVKYSHSCPGHAESQIIIDHGIQFAKPALYGSTYLDLEAGPHLLAVSHPWCTFFDVRLTLEEDGSFTAQTNLTSTTQYPITIRHLPTSEFGSFSWAQLAGGAPTLILFVLGGILLKRCLGSGKVQQALKDAMEQAQQQQQELAKGKEQQTARK